MVPRLNVFLDRFINLVIFHMWFTGNRMRKRIIFQFPQHGGQACPYLEESHQCEYPLCYSWRIKAKAIEGEPRYGDNIVLPLRSSISRFYIPKTISCILSARPYIWHHLFLSPTRLFNTFYIFFFTSQVTRYANESSCNPHNTAAKRVHIWKNRISANIRCATVGE